MQLNDDTIVALSTAAGTGAIAVIRLSGKDAITICDKVFYSVKGVQNLSTKKSHTLHFGTIRKDNTILDEVVVGLFRAPKSFTTEDVVEISCHGSPFIQEQIMHLLLENGARLAKAGEFTLRAYMHGRIDLSQAEAVADLIAADSAAARDIAIKNLRGGFSNDIKVLREQLLNFAALMELELDFSEEDVEFADRKAFVALIEKINETLEPLIDSFSFGNVIKNGVNTVIVGKPNAGKSTLLNALLNEERAIVSDIAGTTRDTIEETMTIDGILFRFIDTAGLRESIDVIEQAGVKKSMEKVQSANLILYLFDVNACSPQELKKEIEALNLSNSAYLVCVGSKADLQKNADYQKSYAEFAAIFLSAKAPEDLRILKKRLSTLILQNRNLQNESTVVANARHYEALVGARKAMLEVRKGISENISGELLSQDIKQALNYLAEICGEVTNDEVLGAIFSKFCIGK